MESSGGHDRQGDVHQPLPAHLTFLDNRQHQPHHERQQHHDQEDQQGGAPASGRGAANGAMADLQATILSALTGNGTANGGNAAAAIMAVLAALQEQAGWVPLAYSQLTKHVQCTLHQCGPAACMLLMTVIIWLGQCQHCKNYT